MKLSYLVGIIALTLACLALPSRPAQAQCSA